MPTLPTKVSIDAFLETVSKKRQDESRKLITIMQSVSGETPVMWGPSIIGFGSHHYKYESGHEGDMPRLAFSPRKASLTVYFNMGFDNLYADELAKLGKYKTSKACLYINKLEDVDINMLESMIRKSFSEAPTPPQ